MQAYIRAMDVLHRFCLIVAGFCLVVITIIIPWGVFTRYVLGYGSSWPEPMAVLLMIWFSFIAAALCYREHLHIAVNILPSLVGPRAKIVLRWFVELCMGGMNLFMLIWGLRLVRTTWYQTIAEFPIMSVGLSYVPVPLGGAIIVLFVIERLWAGKAPPSVYDDALEPITAE